MLDALDVRPPLELELVWLAEVPFEQYERAIRELQDAGSIVAVGFDFAALAREVGYVSPARRARHLARLTPGPEDSGRWPTTADADFDYGYRGSIRLFDDSGEMGIAESVVPWEAVLVAARRIDGAFWAVRRTNSD
jgi:hypothetical protein